MFEVRYAAAGLFVGSLVGAPGAGVLTLVGGNLAFL